MKPKTNHYMSNHSGLTPKEKDFFDRLMKWQRLRNLNYASKMKMQYNQAMNYLFRRNFEEQIKELDRVCDPEFHSSKMPVQEMESKQSNLKRIGFID